MKKTHAAGVDFGSTLIKAYWRVDKGPQVAAVGKAFQPEDLIRNLRNDGVQKVRIVGIGSGEVHERLMGALKAGFEVIGPSGDVLADELRLQALGARVLKPTLSQKKMLVVGAGTGVSYASMKGKRVRQSPVGNCHGGGTIMGLAGLLGIDRFADLEQEAGKTEPGDLLLKHRLPSLGGTPQGEFVIAHFAKPDATLAERCASIFNLAVASIMKDVAFLTALPFSPKDVVLVGGLAASHAFRRFVAHWAPIVPRVRFHEVERPRFSAAAGAWFDIS